MDTSFISARHIIFFLLKFVGIDGILLFYLSILHYSFKRSSLFRRWRIWYDLKFAVLRIRRTSRRWRRLLKCPVLQLGVRVCPRGHGFNEECFNFDQIRQWQKNYDKTVSLLKCSHCRSHSKMTSQIF